MKRILGFLSLIIIIMLLAGCATRAPTEDEMKLEEVEEDTGGQIGLTILNRTDNVTVEPAVEEIEEETVEIEDIIEEEQEGFDFEIMPVEEIEVVGEDPEPVNLFKDLEVHFIDAGEGDAILLQTPSGKNIMVDCGSEETARKIRLFLDKKGVEEIDVLLLSNGHDDHIGGCARLVEAFDVVKIYYNGIDENTETFEALTYNVRYQELDMEMVREDTSIEIDGDIGLQMLIPFGKNYITNIEDNSILLRVTYGDTSMLLTGACGVGCEKRLLEKEKLVAADVLKLGRHGSIEASSPLFLDAVNPKIAIITGEGSRRRDMPTFDLLTNLNKRNIDVYRTDYDGTISLSSDSRYIQQKIEWGAEHFDWESPTNTSYTPYKDCTYISHVTSNVFMPLECPEADNIAAQNRICYKTRIQAIDLGLGEFRHCDSYWWED